MCEPGQERFARKNEAEDLRRAFDILDTKKCVPAPTQAGSLVCRALSGQLTPNLAPQRRQHRR